MTRNIIKIPSLEVFTCGTGIGAVNDEDSKDEKPRVDKMTRLREMFDKSGTVNSVRAIILVHLHNHPHVLLLEKQNPDKSTSVIIPGGRLNMGEDEEDGLQRLLNKKIRLVDGKDYEINELLAYWYRPQFTDQILPYCPVHITTPKETERWYLVLLPEKGGSLGISKKYKLQAVPFYDLQDGIKRFGKQLPTIPLLVSRFEISPIPFGEEQD